MNSYSAGLNGTASCGTQAILAERPGGRPLKSAAAHGTCDHLSAAAYRRADPCRAEKPRGTADDQLAAAARRSIAHAPRRACRRAAAAGSEWQGYGLVFAQPHGRPIDPSADHAAWKETPRQHRHTTGMPARRKTPGGHVAAESGRGGAGRDGDPWPLADRSPYAPKATSRPNSTGTLPSGSEGRCAANWSRLWHPMTVFRTITSTTEITLKWLFDFPASGFSRWRTSPSATKHIAASAGRN
jgi:hypothetical protein